MSPDVHVPGAALPHLPPRASIGTLQFDESGRPRRYKSLQTGVPPAQLVMLDCGTSPECLPRAGNVARRRLIRTELMARVQPKSDGYTLSQVHEHGGTYGYS